MAEPLTFGIFPLGVAGSPDGVASGPPDDFGQIEAAFTELQGDGPPILPRMYVSWTGPDSTEAVLGQVAELAAAGLPWDLALCYRDTSGSVSQWASFVSRVVAGYGHTLAAVQVTGEPNLAGIPGAADGAYPQAREALVAGVLAAAAAKRDTHWELFTLRDADSSNDGMFYNFGILRDDYSPKPAFARLRALIAELGRPSP
jgi:hypothetical protein